MQLTVVITLLAAGLAASQSSSASSSTGVGPVLSPLSSCAKTPFINAVKAAGCSLEDYICQCTTANEKFIINRATPGLKASCSNAAITNAIESYRNVCKAIYSGSATPTAPAYSATSGSGIPSSAATSSPALTTPTADVTSVQAVGPHAIPQATMTGGAGSGRADGGVAVGMVVGVLGVLGGLVV